MNPPRPPHVDDLVRLLPSTEALRPLIEMIMVASRPDPMRRWAGSGELGTVGSRVVEGEALDRALPDMMAAEATRLEGRARTLGALARALGQGDAAEAVTVLLAQGADEESASHMAEAEGWYLAARAVATRERDPRAVEALRKAARVARGLGALEVAARRYEEAWEEALALGLDADAVVAGTGRGNTAVDRGRWAEAEGWYQAALERTGEGDAGLQWPLAQNLAITAREEGRFDDAATWLSRGEAWADQAMGSAAGSGETPWHRLDFANGWGQLALARGQVELALARFQEALEAPGWPLSRIGVQVNLGQAFLAAGRFLEAAEAAREAEAEALRHRVVGRLPEVYRLLASVARARGEAEAFLFLDHALQLIRRHRLPAWEEIRTLRAYADLRRGEGEVAAADDAEQRARALEGQGPDRVADEANHGGEEAEP